MRKYEKDFQLVQNVLKHNPLAIEKFYFTMIPEIEKFLKYYISNREEIEDVARDLILFIIERKSINPIGFKTFTNKKSILSIYNGEDSNLKTFITNFLKWTVPYLIKRQNQVISIDPFIEKPIISRNTHLTLQIYPKINSISYLSSYIKDHYKILSLLEKEILILFLQDFKYEEIIKKLNITNQFTNKLITKSRLSKMINRILKKIKNFEKR